MVPPIPKERNKDMADPMPPGLEAKSSLTAIPAQSGEPPSTETVTGASTMGAFPPKGGDGEGGFGGFPGGPPGGDKPHGPPSGRPTMWDTVMPIPLPTTVLTTVDTTIPASLAPSASGIGPSMMSAGGPSASSILYNSPGGPDSSSGTMIGTVTGIHTSSIEPSSLSFSAVPMSSGGGATNTFLAPFPVTSDMTSMMTVNGTTIPTIVPVVTSIPNGGSGTGSNSGSGGGAGGGSIAGSGSKTISSIGPAGTAALGSQSGDGANQTPSPVAANSEALVQRTNLGIGVGVAIWFLITVALFTWWWFRRRRQMQNGSFRRFEDFDPQRDMIEARAVGPLGGPGTGAGAAVATAYGAGRAPSVRSEDFTNRRMSRETNPGLRSHPIPEVSEISDEELGMPRARYSHSEVSSISDFENVQPTEPVFALPDFPLPAHTVPGSTQSLPEPMPTSVPPYSWTEGPVNAADHTTAPKSGASLPNMSVPAITQTVYAYVHPSSMAPPRDPIPSLPFYNPQSGPRRTRSVTNRSEYTASEYSADPRSPMEAPPMPTSLPAHLPHGFPNGIPSSITRVTSNGFPNGQPHSLLSGISRFNAGPEDNRRRSRMASLHESIQESIDEKDEYEDTRPIQSREDKPHVNGVEPKVSRRISKLSNGDTRPMSVMSMRELIARRSMRSITSVETRF